MSPLSRRLAGAKPGLLLAVQFGAHAGSHRVSVEPAAAEPIDAMGRSRRAFDIGAAALNHGRLRCRNLVEAAAFDAAQRAGAQRRPQKKCRVPSDPAS